MKADSSMMETAELEADKRGTIGGAASREGSLLYLYESRLRRLKEYEETVYGRYHGSSSFREEKVPAEEIPKVPSSDIEHQNQDQAPLQAVPFEHTLPDSSEARDPKTEGDLPNIINVTKLETDTIEDISVSTGMISTFPPSVEPRGVAREEEDETDAEKGEPQSPISGGRSQPDSAKVQSDTNNSPPSTQGDPSSDDENGIIDRAFTYKASPDSKYEEYSCLIDPNQDDRAVEISLYSAKRPHMRAFHLAWLGFFAAFFNWFGIAPLMSQVAHSLKISRSQVWTANTMAVVGSFITRVVAGPLNDIYGSRILMCAALLVSAIPAIISGAVIHGAISLYIIRFLVGIAGCAFVTCQFWTSSMFTTEVAGTALSLTAGWGNLGGGVSQIVMGSLLFPLFNLIYGGDGYKEVQSSVFPDNTDGPIDRPSDMAWRTILAIPGIISLIVAYLSFKHADDSPKGNFGKRKKLGLITQESVFKALARATNDKNTWLMFFQYGCCFGVELTMTSAAALYFQEEFGQTTASAAAIASVFGWMNLFARGLGGFCSDMASASLGMRGRLWVQLCILACQGALVCLFSTTSTLAAAIAVMALFSIFVQAAEGSSFAIVPYIDHDVTGSISGIVGAGGNFGAIAFSLIFRQTQNRTAFLYMGYTVMVSSLLCAFVKIDGHRSLFFGEDAREVKERRNAHTGQLGNLPNVDFRNTESQKRRKGDQRKSFQNEEVVRVTSFDDAVEEGSELANV